MQTLTNGDTVHLLFVDGTINGFSNININIIIWAHDTHRHYFARITSVQKHCVRKPKWVKIIFILMTYYEFQCGNYTRIIHIILYKNHSNREKNVGLSEILSKTWWVAIHFTTYNMCFFFRPWTRFHTENSLQKFHWLKLQFQLSTEITSVQSITIIVQIVFHTSRFCYFSVLFEKLKKMLE